MHVPVLGRAPARFRSGRGEVSVDEQDLSEMVRDDARGDQAGHAGADDDRALSGHGPPLVAIVSPVACRFHGRPLVASTTGVAIHTYRRAGGLRTGSFALEP